MEEVVSYFHSVLIPADRQEVIAPFVRSVVSDMNYETPRQARAAMVALTRLVYWHQMRGVYPLERDVLLRREVIAEFVNEGMREHGKRTQGTYRSRLFRMSDELLSPALRSPVVPSIGAADALAPYSEQQVVQLRTWARHQSTEHRRISSHLILALGLGAGLVAREMAGVRCGDIEVDDAGVQVRVCAERERLVPVTAEWEGLLADVAGTAMRKEQWLLVPKRKNDYSRNFLNNLVAKTHDRPFAISAQRLRATWLVAHLARGVPLDAIYKASGVSSPEALWRYAIHVPEVDPLEARRTLRAMATDLGVNWNRNR